ncbi:hypothetical protein FMO003_10390 [Moritella sp. F3]|nr:hypothetical protein FMO001_03400 [Moritella sp. F1]GIC80758.1 hypothetical protein FMO003_10390 [Moritella sp. F3]
MDQLIKCTTCDSEAQGSGHVSCLCDKDHCSGQRCAANSLSKEFKCSCGATGMPEQTLNYMKKHCS